MNMMTAMGVPPGLHDARRLLNLRVLLERFERDDMERAVDLLLAMMDAADGDTDVELNGDEEDDPGDLRDTAYVEWLTRGRHKVDQYGAEIIGRGPQGLLHEDAEDDDAAEEHDEPEDEDSDRCLAGDDHMIAGPVIQRDQWERWQHFTGTDIGDEQDAEPDRFRRTGMRS